MLRTTRLTIAAIAGALLTAMPMARAACVAPPDGLVSWWPGDGDATDIWAGNDGTLLNGTSFVTGLVSQAFHFDGVDDYVRVPETPTLDLSEAVTVDAWIRRNGTLSYSAVASKYMSAPVSGYLLRVSGPNGHVLQGFVGVGGTSYYAQGTTFVPDNVWVHVAMTYDGETVRVYYNGQLDGSNAAPSGPIGLNDVDFRIGRLILGTNDNLWRFKGDIDEVEVFNRALSQPELQAIFDADADGKCKDAMPVCGNGVVEGAESCDDGNILDGDGCSSSCAVEQTLVCTPAPSGLVSWWQGENDASDLWGGNDGALVGDTSYVAGRVGNAFDFDGAGDQVAVPSADNLNLTEAVTVDAWVKRTADLSFWGTIAAKYGADPPSGYWLRIGGTVGHAIEGLVGVGGSWYYARGGYVALNVWTHLAMTYDGETLRVYQNGVLAASNSSPSGPMLTNNEGLEIGSLLNFSGNNWEFTGVIDEIEVFNRALTDTELLAIHDAGAAGKCTDTTPPACGDGIVEGAETCDDGDTDDGDGCSSTCLVEDGYQCGGGPSVCSEILCVDPPDDLVSWWTGDVDGSDAAGDNDGVLLGDISIVSGMVDDAFHFDGSGDAVMVPDATDLDLTAVTVDAWVRRTGALPWYATIAGKWASTADSGYWLRVTPSFTSSAHTAQALVGVGGTFHYVTAGELPLNEWVHLAMSYDGETLRLYRNGWQVASLGTPSGPLSLNDEPLSIGAHLALAGHDWAFNGDIDEVEVFSRALDDAEILSLYSVGAVGKCKNQPPVAVCQDITVTLDGNGTVTVNAADIDGGSTDPEGDTLTLLIDSQASLAFSCADEGPNSVVLSVDDNNGGWDACTAIVTVADAGTCVGLQTVVYGSLCAAEVSLASVADALAAIDAAIDTYLGDSLICGTTREACRLSILQALGLAP